RAYLRTREARVPRPARKGRAALARSALLAHGHRAEVAQGEAAEGQIGPRPPRVQPDQRSEPDGGRRAADLGPGTRARHSYTPVGVRARTYERDRSRRVAL